MDSIIPPETLILGGAVCSEILMVSLCEQLRHIFDPSRFARASAVTITKTGHNEQRGGFKAQKGSPHDFAVAERADTPDNATEERIERHGDLTMTYARIMQKPAVAFPFLDPANPSVKEEPTLEIFYREVWQPEHTGLSQTTLDQYDKYMRKYVLPKFGDWRINRITHAAIQQMVSSCATYKIAKDAKDTLSSVLGYAYRGHQLLLFNPAMGSYSYPPKVDGRERQGATLQDFDQIKHFFNRLFDLKAPTDILKTMTVGLLFGLRPGEDFGLDSPDFDFGHDLLHIHQSYSSSAHSTILKDTKTPRGERNLDIYPYAREMLCRFGFPDGAWITNKWHRRARPNTVARKWADFRKDHNLPNVTIETARHSFATAALRAGKSPTELSAWLGHADPAFTMEHYCRGNMDGIKNLGSEINSALMGDTHDTTYKDLGKALTDLLARIARDDRLAA